MPSRNTVPRIGVNAIDQFVAGNHKLTTPGQFGAGQPQTGMHAKTQPGRAQRIPPRLPDRPSLRLHQPCPGQPQSSRSLRGCHYPAHC